MGGKSKSKSSSSTKAEAQNLNTQGNTAPVITPTLKISSYKSSGQTIDFNVDARQTYFQTDHGAIEGAAYIADRSLATANNALLSNERASKGALATANNAIDRMSRANFGVLDFAEELAKASINEVAQFSEDALLMVDKANESEDAQAYQTLVKWVVVGVVVVLITGKIK